MHVATLADPARLQQIVLLSGTIRPFHQSAVVKDADGADWACAHIAEHLFGVPADRLEGLSFGPLAERLFWIIHHEVRTQRVPEIVLSRDELRRRLWGAEAHRNWLRRLRALLRSMSKLRVGEWADDDSQPPLAKSLPLFDSIEEVDVSREFIFIIGEGFLGSLEAFATEGDDADRYDFSSKKKLRAFGKQQRIQEIYLPVYLGAPAALKKLNLSPRQKRLLQAVIRELTFPPRDKDVKMPPDRSLTSGELIRGDQVRGFGGKGTITCPDLDTDLHHVGFNGNGVRRGQGYKLATWQAKAGYAEHERQKFLRDLNMLSNVLGLIIGAVGKPGGWCPEGRLRIMAGDPIRNRHLEKLHVRIYARADCIETWNRLCGWDKAQQQEEANKEVSKCRFEILDNLHVVMDAENLQQQQVAAELGVSKQALSKTLKTKHCSPAMQERIKEFLDRRRDKEQISSVQIVRDQHAVASPEFVIRKPRVRKSGPGMKNVALSYHDRGWVVVPAETGTKKPHVRWKKYQTERPDREQVIEWWTEWPDANIAVVLGPVSDLLVVDVDGEEPHRILLELCSELPLAPTVKSGNPNPFRYHLYFRHPEGIETRASTTPWNRGDDTHKLELRGQGGILVLPPSLHKSGNRYAWVKDRSTRSIALPQFPTTLLDGLQAAQQANESNTSLEMEYTAGQVVEIEGLNVAKSTADFLAGKYADANGIWNNRLFQAACDLQGRGVPREKAEPLLLRGAQPKTFEDEREAGDTIASAYSQPRTPSRF